MKVQLYATDINLNRKYVKKYIKMKILEFLEIEIVNFFFLIQMF